MVGYEGLVCVMSDNRTGAAVPPKAKPKANAPKPSQSKAHAKTSK